MMRQETIMIINRSFATILISSLLFIFINCSSIKDCCFNTSPQKMYVSYKAKEYRIYQRSENKCDSLLSIYLEDNLCYDRSFFEGVFHADIDFIVKDGKASDISVSCAYMPERMKTHIVSAIKNLAIRSSTTGLIHAKVHVKIDLYNYTSQIRKDFFANHGIVQEY